MIEGDKQKTESVGWFASWRVRLKQLKKQVYVIYLALQDSRTPWYAKVLATVVVGYALSPLDLIPDFIPILGYLDDLILIPLGVACVKKLIPPEVLLTCREKALVEPLSAKPKKWIAAGIIVLIWVVSAAYIVKILWGLPWVF